MSGRNTKPNTAMGREMIPSTRKSHYESVRRFVSQGHQILISHLPASIAVHTFEVVNRSHQIPTKHRSHMSTGM
jgi:hypothetical protein